ncbi:MAG TPA: flagellar hook-associated protein FlgL [Syntrophales bacterium]|nr:flagellar hook-associated protein FlgL [Syntrophales bacterium]
MAMRITENMKYSTSVSSMFNVQNQYNSILEKMASQKRINRISDDPLGMTMLLDFRQAGASIDQYQRNIDNTSGWLSSTESKLSIVGDLLTKATELAVGQGTATVSAESRRVAAESVQQLKEEMLSLANSKYAGRYLFAGSRMDIDPFSSTSQPARIDVPTSASANSFDGTVAAGGSYTGTTNKTYALKIVTGGILNDATYQVSSDGGKTWGAELDDLNTGTVTLSDGISLTFNDNGTNHLAAEDLFHVHAYGGGYYNGNNDDLILDIGRGASVAYNVTGEAVFTGSNGAGTDIFESLDELKTALANNDQQGILAQVDRLKDAREQANFYVSKVGTTMNRLELAKNNLQDFSQKLVELTSNTEDADVAGLATSLAMKEIALKATYVTASKIGSNTILDFIK